MAKAYRELLDGQDHMSGEDEKLKQDIAVLTKEPLNATLNECTECFAVNRKLFGVLR